MGRVKARRKGAHVALGLEFSMGRNVNLGQSSDTDVSSLSNKDTKCGLAGLGMDLSPQTTQHNFCRC